MEYKYVGLLGLPFLILGGLWGWLFFRRLEPYFRVVIALKYNVEIKRTGKGHWDVVTPCSFGVKVKIFFLEFAVYMGFALGFILMAVIAYLIISII